MKTGRRRLVLGWTAVVLIVGLLFLAREGWQRSGQSSVPPAVGQPAPTFVLSDLVGDQVDFADFRGNFVLLGFWASWCPPCRREMPSLEKLHRDFSGNGLTLLAVNVEESHSVVSAFVEREGITFPVLLDSEGRVRRLYGAYQFPIFFLIDRQGRIAARYFGLRDWSSPAVREELSAIIGG